MTLSHKTEQTPTVFDDVLDNLSAAFKTHFQQAQTATAFDQVEKAMHAAFIEAERRVLEEILSQYDINMPFVILDDQDYRQVLRCEQTYTSAVGQLRVKRSLYRAKDGTRSICPLELRAGIVENSWTPSAAKQALLVVSQLTPYEAADLFKEIGGMTPSKSSLDRLPKKLNRQWEANQETLEEAIRQAFEIPQDATTISASLDGVMIPMQGNVVIPGDSRYEEASCGTVTYYNDDGEALSTRRYGFMPEHKKQTLKASLTQDIEFALSQRPDLQLLKIADGAKDNWTFLDDKLPEGKSILDFYHAAEHLKSAFEIAYGANDSKSCIEFGKYRSILRHDERGIDKVIAHLRYLTKKYPRKKGLTTELNYFINNKARCHYAKMARANYPIGSGIVEATCKTLVTQRMKRSGMSWKEKGGQAILTFRALLQSNLFDVGWKALSAEYCKEVKLPKNVVAFP